VEFRAPLATSPALQKVIAYLRLSVPSLEDDRYLAPELDIAAKLIAEDAISVASDIQMPIL
jgi:histidine ammonia-lyase